MYEFYVNKPLSLLKLIAQLDGRGATEVEYYYKIRLFSSILYFRAPTFSKEKRLFPLTNWQRRNQFPFVYYVEIPRKV